MQLKDVVGSLFELWNLMDTMREERSKLSRIISVLDISESEVVEPGALSLEVIQQVCKHFPPLIIFPYLLLCCFFLLLVKFHFHPHCFSPRVIWHKEWFQCERLSKKRVHIPVCWTDFAEMQPVVCAYIHMYSNGEYAQVVITWGWWIQRLTRNLNLSITLVWHW